ncbi:MAG TPA: outer membrane lipoprotein carrier protein LolA [Flavobacteriaceae bacterium]|nr:outer membrane lipoprotein carrier protein LolA [Flavobacteriaceae bacterium]HPF10805.1 outer membrane lipoprotein carrier protein LolA [Flavobacteriaceae bacterium]HQU20986.1 outer membrane lipoprotein carrier protein LolA [Flavobacteriaceae bacterium]HQU66272.1 outer membrane lipoprotein carrier protein LolA [Flavobacteriaceae bacterium]HRW44538.1 outer membrane lipoprotein carrier protein LolA [Flavobacteriaceae bacterium]
MKKAVLLFATVFYLGFAHAQEAKKLLDEVSSKVKSYDNIYIDFKWNLTNEKEKVNQETRGDVTIAGNKYVLNMLGSTRMFDGQKLYTIVPEDEEVTISKHNPSDEKEITPSKLLTFYEKGYTYKMDIVQNVKGRKIQYVKLTPIDSKAEIKNILLGIDAQTKHIYRLIQTDDNGTKYTLTVNSFKTNEPLSKTLFTFDQAKYEREGYYINQLN